MAMHRWTRISSRKWEDAWVERLRFVDPQHIAMTTWPDSRALKIEVFCTRNLAQRLAKSFGGQISQVSQCALRGSATASKKPLSIRGKLHIFSEKTTRYPTRDRSIWIPAGMTFGTGGHATTASCLRLLCDLVPSLPTNWRALDVGTGSGILGIAAVKLGAAKVDALDFDPTCVRIARANACKNKCKNMKVVLGDARDLYPFTRVDVILANLFSELLLSSAPGFARKLKSRGWLIFSGILYNQLDEVQMGLQDAGFEPLRILKRGKWCAGVTRRKSLLTHHTVHR